MGTVYSAYDIDLDRKVAIKVLADTTKGERVLVRNQRLVREAKAMAKLSHPHVLPVHEVGIVDDGVFIVMEFIDGADLAQWLRVPRTWREIVDVFCQAARGLAAAHDAGIVHRDFKPANVLVDKHDNVRVTDFGIALIISDPHAPPHGPATPGSGETGNHASKTLTDAGVLVGTPAYMSPEQHRGEAADARSDQFSFCVALWEALYGKRPFSGSRKELADNVIHGRIEKPDPKSPVPAWVAVALSRGLSVNRDDRYASMTELADVLARDPRRTRNRILAFGAAGLAIASIAAAIAWAVSSRGNTTCGRAEALFAGTWDEPTREALRRAFATANVPYAPESAKRVEALLDDYRDHWLSARVEACRATRERGDQSEHVMDLQNACLDRHLGEVRALTTALASNSDPAVIERAIEAASSLSSVTPCGDTAALLRPGSKRITAELRQRIDEATALDRLGRTRETLPTLPQLVEAARATGDSAVLAEVLELHGRMLDSSGKYPEAERALTEALRQARLAGDNHRFATTAIALVDSLANAKIVQGREALGVARVALTAIEDARDPVLTIRLVLAQAAAYFALGRPPEALPLARTAFEQAQRVLGPDHLLTLQAQMLYVHAVHVAKGWAESKPIYEATIATATRSLGKLHPRALEARLDRCVSMSAADVDAGQRCLDETLPDADRVFGRADKRPITARVMFSLELLYMGRFEATQALLRTVERDLPKLAWDEKWFVTIDFARTLGQAEVLTAQYAPALEHCKLASATLGEQHKALEVETCIGEALLGLGDNAKALAQLEVLESLTADAPFDSVGRWRFAYARAVLASRKDAVRARALAQQARTELAKAPAWLIARIDAWLASLG